MKQVNEAQFLLTAQNRSQRAFGEVSKGFTEMQARAEKFNKRLARMNTQGGSGGRGGVLSGLGRYLAPAVAFAGVREVMKMGDEIGDAADSMQVSAETFQTLKVLARDTAVSMTGLGKAFASLNEKKIEAMADETSAARQNFDKLNLKGGPLYWQNAESLFENVARVMRDPLSTMEQLAAAQDLLGSSATKLGPVYEALANTSFAELNKALIKSGQILDEHGIKKISQLEAKYQGVLDRAKTIGMNAVAQAPDMLETAQNYWSDRLASPLAAGIIAVRDAKDRVVSAFSGSSGQGADGKVVDLLTQLLRSSKMIEQKDGGVFK